MGYNVPKNKSNLRWIKNNPEKDKKMKHKAQKKYRKLHKKELAEKSKITVCDIIKEHDIKHKDDSESLDIKKFLDA